MGMVTLMSSLTAARLAGRRAGLAAGLLLVLAPSIQRYAQEARAYAIPAMFIAIATYILVVALQRKSTLPLKVSYGVSILLAGIIQPAALAVLVAHGYLAFSTNKSRSDFKSWIFSLTALIPLVPLSLYWIRTYSVMHERDGDDIFNFHPAQIGQALTNVSTGGAFHTTAAGAFAMAIILLAITNPDSRRWLFGVLGSLLAIYVVSFTTMNWWYGRTLVPLTSLVVIAASMAFAEYNRIRYILTFVVIFAFTWMTYTENRLPWTRDWDYRGAAQILDSNWLPRDFLLMPNPDQFWLFNPTVLNLYGGGAEKYQTSLKSATRIWIPNERGFCDPIDSWDLGNGNNLTLCAASSVDLANYGVID